MVDGVTLDYLAEDLGFLQPDDVRAVIVDHLRLDLHDDIIPTAVCVEVRDVLSPNGERTAPAPFFWVGHPLSWAGESPTAGEGDYEGMFDW